MAYRPALQLWVQASLSAMPDGLLFPLLPLSVHNFYLREAVQIRTPRPIHFLRSPWTSTPIIRLTNGPPSECASSTTVVIYAPVEAILLWTVPDYECQFQATPSGHPSLVRGKKTKKTSDNRPELDRELSSLFAFFKFPPTTLRGRRRAQLHLVQRGLRKNVRGMGFNQRVKPQNDRAPAMPQCNNVWSSAKFNLDVQFNVCHMLNIGLDGCTVKVLPFTGCFKRGSVRRRKKEKK